MARHLASSFVIAAQRYGLVAALGVLWVGCVAQSYSYQPRGGSERALQPVHAKVVTHREAVRHGPPTPLSIPFAADRDGTELVGQFLAQADARHAAQVADVAIYLQTRHDEQIVECRSEVVPEEVTASEWRPPTSRLESVNKPVTRTVTESVYRCRPVTSSQMRSYTEYQQQCSTVSHPVQRSRTTYSSSYSSLTHSSTSTPHTEYYTEYQSSYECRSVPVSRMRSEMVTETRCSSEMQSRIVTQYEFQLENRYVPGHFESFTRQRLRELEPVCYTRDAASEPAAPQNRIEGLLFGGR